MDLIHHVDLEASREQIYKALTTEEGVRGWWTADAKVEPRQGGKAEFGFNERAVVFRMNIVKLEPSRRVVWECTGEHPEWEGTRLEWEIGEGMVSGQGLWLRHKGWKEVTTFAASCNSTWGHLMYILKDYVEGKKPGPQWTE